jgi:SAM-dependent methyltransferase
MRMRLNIGSWAFPAPPPWINVDRHDFRGVHVLANVAERLPFDDGSAERIYVGHVLEHLAYDTELPAALAEIRRVLHPDGGIMVVGPDLERAKRWFPAEVTNIWPGQAAHDGLGGAHLWPSTVPDTTRALREAGFYVEETPISQVPSTWPVVSRIGWQFALRAWHPLGPYRRDEQTEEATA